MMDLHILLDQVTDFGALKLKKKKKKNWHGSQNGLNKKLDDFFI